MKFNKIMIALGIISTLPSAYANTDSEPTEILTYNYTYNDDGQVKTVDGPRVDVEDITTYDYEQGELTKITNALGHVTERKDFDDYFGLPQTLIDANGVVTKLTYDGQGRLETSTLKSSAGDLTTTYVYDDATGLVTQITQPDGSETHYEYDVFMRLKATYNGLGERIEYELDDMGNITKETIKSDTGAITKVHQKVFDELGRLIESISAGDLKVKYRYDKNSNLTAITNPSRHESKKYFDALGRLYKSKDALSQSTYLEYNQYDQLKKVKHPNSVTTEFKYDDFGRLVERISPDSGVTTYKYDEANNIIESTDATGKVTTFVYDELNRIKEKWFNRDDTYDYTITYVYDETENGNVGIGRLTGVKDAHGIYAYQYDDRGNLVAHIRSTTYDTTQAELVTRYHYNTTNQLEGITYPSGIRASYQWDDHGRIEAVTAQLPGEAKAKSLVSGLTYLPYGGVTHLTWGNQLSLERTFDQDYRIETQIVEGVDNRVYSYDDNSNVEAIQRGDNSQTFDYDRVNRLTEETGSYGKITYKYDKIGNRTYRAIKIGRDTEKQRIEYHRRSNRLKRIDKTTVTHTDSGNLMGFFGDSYQYDPIGRLFTISTGSTLKIKNAYDAYGRRLVRSDNTAKRTLYTYSNGGRLLSELTYQTSKQQQSSEYIWLGDTPIAHITGVKGKYTINYIHTDHLNTPRYATNDQKKVTWQWESDAFGVGDANEDVDGDGIKTVISLRFPGQVYDSTTGLFYNYHRDYDPNLGRYVQTDPIGLAGGMNTYAYAGGNPINFIDPLGLSKKKGGFDPLELVPLYSCITNPTFFNCATEIPIAKPVKWCKMGYKAITKGPIAGGGAKLDNLAPAEIKRIQNAANRTGQDITVVGSRASGKASPTSDWDYVMSGKSSKRHSASSSVPRGTSGGAENSMGRETGIDVFQSYNSKAPDYTKVNTNQPYITFSPQ